MCCKTGCFVVFEGVYLPHLRAPGFEAFPESFSCRESHRRRGFFTPLGFGRHGPPPGTGGALRQPRRSFVPTLLHVVVGGSLPPPSFPLTHTQSLCTPSTRSLDRMLQHGSPTRHFLPVFLTCCIGFPRDGLNIKQSARICPLHPFPYSL